MSNETPESQTPKHADTGAVPQVSNGDAEVQNPPSEPVSARGHINTNDEVPASTSANEHVAAPAERGPVAPEPAAASHDEVAAAVARTNADAPATRGESSAAGVTEPATAAYTKPPLSEPVGTYGQGHTAAPIAGAAAGTAAGAAAGAAAAGEPTRATTVHEQAAPVYVSAPVRPRRRSNRGLGTLIALLGAVVFAVVYAAVVAVVGALSSTESFLSRYVAFLGTQSFYIPVIFFAIALVLLVLILNRAGWWAYIIGGFVVAVIVYFAFIGGTLLTVQAWNHTPAEVGRLISTLWLNPFGIAAGVVAREVSIWTGAWLAAHGRYLRIKNAEAQAEYEREVSEGPRTSADASRQSGYAPTV